MPCWTVAESKVNLNNADQGLLEKALAKIGFSNVHKADSYSARFAAKLTADRFDDNVSVKLLNNGTVSVTKASYSSADLDSLGREIKRAYSGEVITDAASRFGWMLKPAGESKWQVLKR